MGETSYKQQWKHRHSDYEFIWHRVLGKSSEENRSTFELSQVSIMLSLHVSTMVLLLQYHSKRTLSFLQ
jgi:hypothetical protein